MSTKIQDFANPAILASAGAVRRRRAPSRAQRGDLLAGDTFAIRPPAGRTVSDHAHARRQIQESESNGITNWTDSRRDLHPGHRLHQLPAITFERHETLRALRRHQRRHLAQLRPGGRIVSRKHCTQKPEDEHRKQKGSRPAALPSDFVF